MIHQVRVVGGKLQLVSKLTKRDSDILRRAVGLCEELKVLLPGAEDPKECYTRLARMTEEWALPVEEQKDVPLDSPLVDAIRNVVSNDGELQKEIETDYPDDRRLLNSDEVLTGHGHSHE